MGILRDNRGMALVVVIIMCGMLLALTGGTLLFSGLNLKTSSNYKIGSTTLHAADAGLQHALAVIPAGTDFDGLLTGTVSSFPCRSSAGSSGTCDGVTYFPTLTGSIGSSSYTVVVTNDTTVAGETATNDTNRKVILTVTATGPDSSKKVIVAHAGRTGTFSPPGATYLPGQADKIETQLTGNALISGYDHDVNGNQVSGATAVPGISTTTSGTEAEIDSALGSNSTNVVGSGGNSSVSTTSVVIDVTALANSLLSSYSYTTLEAGTHTNVSLGTAASPQITRVTGDVTFSGNDTSSGYGILIIEGDFKVAGNFEFKGLVIALGDVDVELAGNGTIVGTLMVPESTTVDNAPELKVTGNGTVKYSSSAISTYVNTNWGSALPQAAKLLAWREKL